MGTAASVKARTRTNKVEINPFDDLIEEVGQIIGDLDLEKPTTSLKTKKRTKQKSIYSSAQQTFIEIAQLHMRPVCRYMKAIEKGVQSKLLLEITSLVVNPLLNNSKKMKMNSHYKALRLFKTVVDRVSRSSSKMIDAEQFTALIETFEPVEKLFKLDFRGHSVAVLNLVYFFKKLKSLSSIGQDELRKLFAIGIPSMTMLRKTALDELVSLSGIKHERMSEIRRTARDFELLWILE